MAKNSTNPNVITIASQKGGVGKTSLSVNLGEAFAIQGKRVLLLDFDYQGDASDWLGVADRIEEEKKSTTWALVKNKKIPDLRVPSSVPGLDVIGSDLSLNFAIQKFNGQQEQFNVVKRMLDCPEKHDYDIILIDTHPSLDPLLTSALNYSHYYLVPMFPEKHPFKGLEYLMRVVGSVKENQNPMLFFLGIVITKFIKKSKSHNDYLEVIRTHAKEAGITLHQPFIRDSASIISAAGSQNALSHYISELPVKPKNNVGSDYMQLAESLSKLLKGKRQGRPQKVPDPIKMKLLSENSKPDNYSDEFGSMVF